MPRNIEDHLEDHINRNEFELFVLTYAIAIGISVPNKILKKNGTQYGPDNFFHDMSQLERARLELKKLNKPSREELLGYEHRVLQEIEKIHKENVAEYENSRFELLQRIRNSSILVRHIHQLPVKNKEQLNFKNKMLSFLQKDIKNNKVFLSKLKPKPKLSPKQYDRKYGKYNLEPYYSTKRYIKRLEKELIKDAEFSAGIQEDWLSKKPKI